MNYLATHENKPRGTFDFPIELYYVSPQSVRYHMPFHWHLDYELIYVLQGELSLSLNAETKTLRAGDAAFVPEGIIHGGVPSACVYECIVFDLTRFLHGNSVCRRQTDKLLASQALSASFFIKGSKAADLIDLIFEAMEKEQQGYELVTVGLLWQLMGALSTAPSLLQIAESPKRVLQMKRALQKIRKDFAETITLDELALEAGMSPKYFCRAFAKTTGRTPVDYLNYYRVECACELLLASEESVTEIALSCGFNDISYFARAFKKYKGISAKKYRLNMIYGESKQT